MICLKEQKGEGPIPLSLNVPIIQPEQMCIPEIPDGTRTKNDLTCTKIKFLIFSHCGTRLSLQLFWVNTLKFKILRT